MIASAFFLGALLLASPALGQWDPHMFPGRTTIVQLFQWKWGDIAEECERFLGPMGYGGIQIPPPQEHPIIRGEQNRPWWERYQSVSYKLISRSGDEAAFADMVARCNNAGVRVYVDVLMNHATGGWPPGTPTTGGSGFDSDSLDYPGVPYSALDFHGPNECSTASGEIENYNDPYQVRNCMLVGLRDLKMEAEYVREKEIEYLNHMIDLGVAGFRCDAAKHMWPEDMVAVLHSLKDLNTDYFEAGSRPFVVQEVIDLGGEAITSDEYLHIGRVTEFKYGRFLGDIFHRYNELQYVENFGEEWGMIAGLSSLVFVDNHDNQRGHGGGGSTILTFRQSRWYKMANAFMLAWPYGFPRVMSSYYWDEDWQNGEDKNNWVGPPMDENEDIISPEIQEDLSCAMPWICEHRWRQIYNMVGFKNAVGIAEVSNFVVGTGHQIAFARDGAGFIAINNDEFADFAGNFATTLEAGDYCDVISGGLEGGACSGKVISVDGSGTAYIEISASDEDPVVAIHVNARL